MVNAGVLPHFKVSSIQNRLFNNSYVPVRSVKREDRCTKLLLVMEHKGKELQLQ